MTDLTPRQRDELATALKGSAELADHLAPLIALWITEAEWRGRQAAIIARLRSIEASLTATLEDWS